MRKLLAALAIILGSVLVYREQRVSLELNPGPGIGIDPAETLGFAGGADLLPLTRDLTEEVRAPADKSTIHHVSGNVILEQTGLPAIGNQPLDGTMVLGRVGRGKQGTVQRIQINGGKWAADLKLEATYDVIEIGLRGLQARVVGETRHVSTTQTTVHVQIEVGAELRVVDCETGAELRNVDVLSVSSWGDMMGAIPGSSRDRRVLLSKVDSPLNLPAGQEVHTYWVGSRGYAWNRVTVGIDQESMTVCLERCGALGVELPLGAGGRPKELQVLLRKLVKGEGAEVISQRRLEGMAESVAWENLTVGTYEVLLGCLVGRDQSKRISSAPRLLAVDWMSVGTVDIEFGRRSLLVAPGPFSWAVGGAIMGTVLVPPHLSAYLDERFSILLTRMGPGGVPTDLPIQVSTRACKAFEGGFRWQTLGLRPGEYSVRLLPHGISATVLVEEGNRSRVEMDLQACELLSVGVRGSGPKGVPCEFSWRLLTDKPELRDWGRVSVAMGEEAVFLAAQGLVECLVGCAGHQLFEKTIASGVGVPEFIFELEEARTVRLHVQFVSAGGPVYLPLEYFINLQVTDAKGAPVRHRYEPENPDGYSSYGYNTKAAGAILAVKGRGVGDLKLRFSEIKGYLPIKDQSVRIKQGEVGALKIELRSVWDD